MSDFESNQFNNTIEGLIMSTNGPKSAEKIYNLFKTAIKPYNENQTKEILKNMLILSRLMVNFILRLIE